MDRDTWWLLLGLAGQLSFTGRFLVQWLVSERQKRSVVPQMFWYLSIVGGSLLLMYAVYRQDLVFIIGQASGLAIYLRNLYFIRQIPEAASKC